MAYNILVVEDDQTLLETLEYNLEREGYTIYKADNGRYALNLAQRHKPELVLLDIMLPGMDGFEVCRILRQNLRMPILMLTARADEIDKIVGLEVGADDYLTKPFNMRELLARVKALLRRVELVREEIAVERGNRESAVETSKTAVLTFGNLTIDQSRREIRVDGELVRLKPKEFDLLVFLAQNQGRALSRDLILDRVWEWAYDGDSRTVDVHVRWLREKIEPDPANAQRIITIHGIGYRFDG